MLNDNDKDAMMTLLKTIILGSTVLPLAVSSAFAATDSNSVKGAVMSITTPAQMMSPASSLSEKRVIKGQVTTSAEGDNIEKMIHYSETSGTHNPYNSKIFDQMERVDESVIQLDPVRPTVTRPSITYDQADAMPMVK
jgi:hypothetical protein